MIHNDKVISEDDIKSFIENDDVITNEFIFMNKILFNVINIIEMIIICQYIFFIVYVRRSRLDKIKIFSSIFSMIMILLYQIHMYGIL